MIVTYVNEKNCLLLIEIDQLLSAVMNEDQMLVFTSLTGLNLLLVFFLR